MGVPGHFDGNNFGGKMAGLPRIGGALVAFNSVGVLSFAGEFVICRRLKTKELFEMKAAVVARKQRKLLWLCCCVIVRHDEENGEFSLLHLTS